MRLVEGKTKELAMELGAFCADQFLQEGDTPAHFIGTASKIWNASNGSVTAFCDFVGTGGKLWWMRCIFSAKGCEVLCSGTMGCGCAFGKRGDSIEPLTSHH
jgi:cysteine synthase A